MCNNFKVATTSNVCSIIDDINNDKNNNQKQHNNNQKQHNQKQKNNEVFYVTRQNPTFLGQPIEVEEKKDKQKLEPPKKDTKKITQGMRSFIFNHYCGTVTNIGKCFCCLKTIHFTEYQCGHVKARAEGGKVTKKNLRPLCAQCNQQMRTTHMMDYMWELYAESMQKLLPEESEKKQKNEMWRMHHEAVRVDVVPTVA